MASRAALQVAIETASSGEAPIGQRWRRVWSPEESVSARFVRATTSGATISLAEFSVVDAVIVRNGSSVEAESVTAQFTTVKASTTYAPGQISYSAGGQSRIDNADSTFISDGFVLPGRVRLENAQYPVNDGSYVLERVRAEVLEMQGGEIASSGPDNGTPTISMDIVNHLNLPSGGLVVAEQVYPADDLVLTSDSGTPRCDVWVMGA